MGMMMLTLAAIGGLLGSVCVGLVKDEASAWMPLLNRLILAAALTRVCAEKRERYAEEWSAHVAEYPGKISQTVQCLRFLRASANMPDIEPARLDRIMAIGASVNGATLLSDMAKAKWSGNNFWLDHLLGFVQFSTSLTFIYCCCYALWMHPSISRAIGLRQR